LNTSASLEIDVFLDLALLFCRSGFVYRHLDDLIVVCNDYGTKGTKFCMHMGVVDRPKPAEV
jgi:hypothetical protein